MSLGRVRRSAAAQPQPPRRPPLQVLRSRAVMEPSPWRSAPAWPRRSRRLRDIARGAQGSSKAGVSGLATDTLACDRRDPVGRSRTARLGFVAGARLVLLGDAPLTHEYALAS